MKKKTLFFPVLAALTLMGCSNDETSEVIPPKVFTGDEAYISVRLSDAGNLTRATTEDPGYEYGETSEHAVKNAYFYFYDENGVFVAEGSAWNSGKKVENGNVEFKSENVIVLKGLTDKKYPKYMVTVLNRPISLIPTTSNLDPVPKSLVDLEKMLADTDTLGITTKIDETDYFVMSTTSWADQRSVQTNYTEGSQKYFVTEVKEANFMPEPVDNVPEENVVNVYVERLAAKVTLKVDANIGNATKIDGETYYKIKASVAGEGNDDDITITDGNQIAAENLYVKLLGWKLNATAKHSYIVKNIDENWTDATLGFSWNKTSDFRSFWGKSFNYGVDSYSYPTTAEDYNEKDYPLTYVKLSNPLVSVGESTYCAENTNTSDIVTKNFPTAVTSILLKAQVCNENGEALSLVRFNGILFTQDDFVKYILNVMKAKNLWNVWEETTPDGATTRTFKQLEPDKVKLVSAHDGKVNIQLNIENFYTREDNNGEYSYSEGNVETVNTNLKTECADAIGYNGGLMYYNIPIEHLNNTAVGESGNIPEAKYGVVRNHHYYVTINKLEKIGKGIYDPDEVIVPSQDDEKDAYYVGANINILSWKIVNQSVEL